MYRPTSTQFSGGLGDLQLVTGIFLMWAPQQGLEVPTSERGVLKPSKQPLPPTPGVVHRQHFHVTL